VKKFIRGEVEQGHWPRVTVDFVPGRTPELFLFDAEGKELERMFVDKLSFADLETLMSTKGFTHSGKPVAERTAAQGAIGGVQQAARHHHRRVLGLQGRGLAEEAVSELEPCIV